MRADDRGSGNAGSGAQLELDSVSMAYAPGLPRAVDDVTLHVKPGEFVTLLGPSGSGKTTTLNLIAGFLHPDDGVIRADGKDISRTPPHRRNFGMVFQNYALFPHMTVAQNIAFPLVERKFSRDAIDRMVNDALDLVDLGGLQDRKPRQLSGGQQQRVALARAIVFSPRLLLLDEPLGALDRRLRQALQNQIRQLHRELGLTFIFVTHDQEEAMSLSDRVAVFNRGSIERMGSPQSLYDDPGSVFVAEFLGESNLFWGTCDGGSYRWGDHAWPLGAHLGGGSSNDVLMIRPERVQLFTDAEDPPASFNRLSATVADAAFLGTLQRVDLRFPGGSAGSAILAGGATTPVPGQQVTAAWDPDHQRLLNRRDEERPPTPEELI